MTWIANESTLYFTQPAEPPNPDFVGLHNASVTAAIAERHNAVLATHDVLIEVKEELERARAHHGSMASAHEAYAVILEELDEFKQHVWTKQSKRDLAAMRAELIQLAAMAVRAVEDLEL